ncbi:MAG: hypothetical protein VST68_13805 [Nitrospirota bacterium]|nr:hypothetical protein [Nitrospirota bacterium]
MGSVLGTERLFREYHHSANVFGQRIQDAGFVFSGTEYVLWVLTMPLVMNLVGDYLALYKTRKLIDWVQSTKSIWKSCVAFFIDQVGVYLCFFLGLFLVTLFIVTGIFMANFSLEGFHTIQGPFHTTASHLLHLLAAMNQPVVMLPCVVSTFFSSVWLWLYCLSVICPKIAEAGSVVGSRLRPSPAS